MDGSNKGVDFDIFNAGDSENKVDLGDVYNGGGDSNDDVGADDGVRANTNGSNDAEFGKGDSKRDCGVFRGGNDGNDKDDGGVNDNGNVDSDTGNDANCGDCRSKVDCNKDVAVDEGVIVNLMVVVILMMTVLGVMIVMLKVMMVLVVIKPMVIMTMGI